MNLLLVDVLAFVLLVAAASSEGVSFPFKDTVPKQIGFRSEVKDEPEEPNIRKPAQL